MTKHLCVGLSLATTWLTGSGWRRAESQVEQIYRLDYYRTLALKAEAAKLDFIFRPDSLFLDPTVLNHTPGFSGLDPTLLMSALAQSTSHIGLVTTISTTFNQPYTIARLIQSLHWVSEGRAGWNIVTALDGNKNFGEKHMPSADQRYEKAQEFVDVVQALWRSYPLDAIKTERHSGQYVNVQEICTIDHHGEYFQVQGPLNIPTTPYGRVPLLQAGASDRGRDFAAKTADAIFAANPDIESGIELSRDIRARAVKYGRGANAIKVLPGLSLYLAQTQKQAEELYQETHMYQNIDKKYKYLQQNLGIDFRHWALDRPVTLQHLSEENEVRSRTHRNLLKHYIERESPTLATLLQRPEVSGSAHWIIIGTVDDAVKSICERVAAQAADGFVALPAGSIDSLDIFLEQLMPRLVEQGLFRKDYTGTTFAEHLQG